MGLLMTYNCEQIDVSRLFFTVIMQKQRLLGGQTARRGLFCSILNTIFVNIGSNCKYSHQKLHLFAVKHRFIHSVK